MGTIQDDKLIADRARTLAAQEEVSVVASTKTADVTGPTLPGSNYWMALRDIVTTVPGWVRNVSILAILAVVVLNPLWTSVKIHVSNSYLAELAPTRAELLAMPAGAGGAAPDALVRYEKIVSVASKANSDYAAAVTAITAPIYSGIATLFGALFALPVVMNMAARVKAFRKEPEKG